MTSRVARAISTWFGCGYAPLAPGTAGSAAAIGIAYCLVRFARWQPLYFLPLSIVFSWPAIWAATITSRELRVKDPGVVVADEVAGQWLTLAGATVFNWKSFAGAFVLFRFFDIWKPPPIRRLEKLPEGTGIVMDDLMAGVYAALVLFLAGCFNLY